MSRWTCEQCDREFARARQSHVCVPGCTVEESFAGRPPVQRDIYEAVIAYLRTLGPVHEDAVSVGVFLKHGSKFAELRPKARGLSLCLMVPWSVDDPRVSRSIRISTERFALFVKLTRVEEVDGQLRDWLGEAYDAAAD